LGSRGRDGIPDTQISVVLAFLAITAVVKYVVSQLIQKFSIFSVGLPYGPFIPTPIQINDLLVFEGRGGMVNTLTHHASCPFSFEAS
jgi:hypothetical protein